MDPVLPDSQYSRFASYDFESDARFQEGLKKLSNQGLLELKIFYYNRFIEPVDLTGFQEWRDRHQDSQTQTSEDISVTTDTNCVKDNSSQRETKEDTLLEKETKSEHGDSLSFAEVFRMIQAGEEIPGLEKLDIKSCNQKPSVSQIPRKLKPWEK
ncbi:uncharacterized protein LOC103039418 [Astyanax mexicanus]|uniref:uncharacterized protein LOC103039418 n=1 Tax=Astyanax mexicanus TaxID=7994 RepID=UPI000BBDFB36|nr:uncharacterized protein LOC103039418 [Astyanax mexicanus]